MSEPNTYHVAVVGAGPAGLFGARELAAQDVRVALFNRDIKPGGLAEYGIYPDKHVMKDGLRKQFRAVLDNPNIDYYGNIVIGDLGDLSLSDLRALGFQAILVTVGAQGTKWLGLPGEELEGVYHAKEIVYGYNKLPPFSQKKFRIGKRCAIVGAGNVMIDVARYLLQTEKVDEVAAIVRRGPGEVNFTKDEMKHIIANLDVPAFDAELRRVLPTLQSIDQDPQLGRSKVMDALLKADPKVADGRFRFEFLASPVQMLGENGLLTRLEVEDNTLVLKDGQPKPKGTGHKRLLELDTVIFAIGDKVDDAFGLPVASNEFVKSETPRFPVENISYESPITDVFVGGWSRKASEGLVGYARRDGTNASKAVREYLQTLGPSHADNNELAAKIKNLAKPIVTKADIQKLEAVEAAEAQKRGLKEFKFASNEEMLQAMGLTITA